ncbi:FKBP-type peptidyl-prolyl cis-trans isomerase [Ferruginibacter sp.]
MLKKFLVIGLTASLFLSCNKDNKVTCPYTESTFVAPSGEVTAVQNYCASAHPAAIQHSSGLFYEITAAGTGTTTASVCSNITIKYSGYLTNGNKFDENLSGITFTLGGLILGWQKGIPLVKKGGSINLYIPPSLGYGSQDVRNNAGVVVIPANSILVFNIQVLDVN